MQDEIQPSSPKIEKTSSNIEKQLSPESPTKTAFNHKDFGRFADSSLQAESELGQNIKLCIDGHETKGSLLTKYVVYHIVGEDKNGAIDVYRRFNQFYKMRVALIKRFPGCFIPSIPDKSISLIDDQITNKRQRFLSDFVKKITKLPHLYNSEQFQALLRSADKDLSSSFDKWPSPTTTDIINRYKDNFSYLSGKVIDTSVRTNIHDFTKLVARTNVYMYKFKNQIKTLATARDKFDRKLGAVFSKLLPSFQQNCLAECVTGQQELIYANPNEAKFIEHQKIVSQTLKRNPYWLLYDLIKHQERDGQAFLQCVKAIEQYENKKYEIEVKLGQNNKAITESTYGKKSNSESKYKLQVENQALKKEKESVQCLTDIIIALVGFIEIDRFKKQKSMFYVNMLKKLGGYEINQVQNMHQVWYDWKKKSQKILGKLASE